MKVNLEGYYDPLIAMLERSIEEKFLNDNSYWTVVKNADELMKQLIGE
jgi:predicted Rossmann-fold nucleotide-binding protein